MIDESILGLDEDIMEEDLMLEEDAEIVEEVNAYDAAIDAQKTLEEMELEVDSLWGDYDGMFQ